MCTSCTNMVGHDSQHKRETVTTERFRSLMKAMTPVELPVELTQSLVKCDYRMTLCGSEVPQDRWRGRTAGSGMWTRTRESVLGAPCGDSAIPYG